MTETNNITDWIVVGNPSLAFPFTLPLAVIPKPHALLELR